MLDRMSVDEGDGRVGVDSPGMFCKPVVETDYLSATLPTSRTAIKLTMCFNLVGERQYTELKCVGDGSFGTVWLCDWHSPVKPDVLLSAMQCGAGARPEWAGKRLVALKRMKRVWEGGWDQAKTLGELVVSDI